MTRRRTPAPVYVILTCTGKDQHTWRHDDTTPYRPRYCVWCGAPYRQAARPEEVPDAHV